MISPSSIRHREGDEGYSVPPHEDACRNLHADDEGLRQLSFDLQKLFPALRVVADPFSFSISSQSSQDTPQPARRRPSKAKRRAWQNGALDCEEVILARLGFYDIALDVNFPVSPVSNQT